MAGAPVSFTTSPFPHLRVEDNRGAKSGSKQLVATRDFNIGDVIFAVDGLLVASRDGWGCIACSDSRCMGWCDPYRHYFVELRPVLLSVTKLAAESNTHPIVLRLVIKFIALKKFSGQNQKLTDLLNNVYDLVNLRDTPLLKKEDLVIADKLYLSLPDSHKPLLTKDQLATLIGRVQTNTHEVPQLQGLGLFPIASLVNHSCGPNTVYETIGTRIIFTAICPIAAGNPITISYINPHLPLVERKELLQATFSFDCKCKRCQGDSRDYCRGFYCHGCLGRGLSPEEAGIVCPSGSGTTPAEWSCSKCGDPVADNVWKEWLVLEQDIKETEIAVVKVNDILNLKKIHPTHYLICRALEYRVELLARIRPTSCEKFILILLAASNDIYPAIHPKRAYYWDLLGQVRKMSGDMKGCKEAFQEAVTIREKSSPRGSPQLILAKQKSINPEKNEFSLWYPTLSM